jgi:hypothetical protein
METFEQQGRPCRRGHRARGCSLKGEKLYDLRGANIYKLNGDLVSHLSDAHGTEKRLDKATDRLFPAS